MAEDYDNILTYKFDDFQIGCLFRPLPLHIPTKVRNKMGGVSKLIMANKKYDLKKFFASFAEFNNLNFNAHVKNLVDSDLSAKTVRRHISSLKLYASMNDIPIKLKSKPPKVTSEFGGNIKIIADVSWSRCRIRSLLCRTPLRT